LVGALAPPPGVVAEKNALHAFALGEEATHPFSRFARLSIFAAGELPFAAKAGPGLLPMLMSASAEAVATAFCRPAMFVELAPRFAPVEKNCESAYMAATVVTSFTTIWLEAAI
jgi:hypothetical protein